ncbi:MAG: hypothetical protein ABI664_05600 [bacterium]
MPDTLSALIIATGAAFAGAGVQYGFRRYTEAAQMRREIVETHLLQLQNCVESLYYRANNLRHWDGRETMSDDYFTQTTAYAIGRVLAHESLLVSKGVYAKLSRNASIKRRVKASLHSLNRSFDDQSFLYYHRLQLGEMALDADRVVSYTQFSARWPEERFAVAVASVSRFVASVSDTRLDTIGAEAEKLVALLAEQTDVPSALELAGSESD